MRRAITISLLVLGTLGLMAGCGGNDSDSKSGGGGSGKTEAQAKELFVQKCGICHELEAAGTNGSQGPPLDALGDALTVDSVRDQIENGGGSMPANLLEGDEADAVAEYVVDSVQE
jgi:cytochrome c551